MRKKVWLAALLLLVMLVQMSTTIFAAAREYYYDNAWHPYEGNEFRLKINGEFLETSMPPIVFEGYSVVPVREVFETLGAKVDWDGQNGIIKITYDSKILLLRVNSTSAQVGTQNLVMPIAPKIINEKTMVPARFVAEQMGLLVEFDSENDTICMDQPAISYHVTNVKWEKNAAGTAGFVTILTDAQNAEYADFSMENPDRVVIDFYGMKNQTGKNTIAVGEKNVQQIRIGEHEDATRIVIDLTEASVYTVDTDGPSVVVTVRLQEDEEQNLPSASETPLPDAEKQPEPVIPPESIISPQPSVSPEPTPSQAPLSRYVTIDAGHGGDDPGAIYRDEEGNVVAQEKDINLDVALRVQQKLEAAGVQVHMIRTTDTYVDFQQVGSIANEMGTTLFVSIHTNSAEPAEASGIETWGYLEGGSEYNGMTSKILSQNIQDELIAATGAKDRGIKDGKNLAVIRTTQMPAALVEVGFITNAEDRQKMLDASYRDQLAEAVTQGVLKSFDEMGI